MQSISVFLDITKAVDFLQKKNSDVSRLMPLIYIFLNLL